MSYQLHREAVPVYHSFRVLAYGLGEEKLHANNTKDWLRDRLKWISDRIMEFSDDVAWQELFQKKGKNRRFVRYEAFEHVEA